MFIAPSLLLQILTANQRYQKVSPRAKPDRQPGSHRTAEPADSRLSLRGTQPEMIAENIQSFLLKLEWAGGSYRRRAAGRRSIPPCRLLSELGQCSTLDGVT